MKILNKDKSKSDFYFLLSKQSDKVMEGMKKFKLYMETSEDEIGQEVIKCEKEADELRRVLIDELNKTFITPFEREDIFNLSRTLDDMLDYASSTYEEMCIFKLKPTEDLRDMFELIYKAAEYIDSAIKYLKNNPAISSEQALNAKKAENKIETKYREFLDKLFMEDDIKYILKMREIFRHLSNLADKIDSTSDTICNIVVKIM